MNIVDLSETLTSLRQQLDLLWDDLTSATACFEAFHVAARDRDLLSRFGPSFAAFTFQAARNALHQEVVLALMRIWDKSSRRHLRVDDIIRELNRPEVISFIEQRRLSDGMRPNAAARSVREELKKVLFIHRRITQGLLTTRLKALRRRRDEFLAHTSLSRMPLSSPEQKAMSPIRDMQYGDERILLRWTVVLSENLHLLIDDINQNVRADFLTFRIAAECFWRSARAETLSEREQIARKYNLSSPRYEVSIDNSLY